MQVLTEHTNARRSLARSASFLNKIVAGRRLDAARYGYEISGKLPSLYVNDMWCHFLPSIVICMHPTRHQISCYVPRSYFAILLPADHTRTCVRIFVLVVVWFDVCIVCVVCGQRLRPQVPNPAELDLDLDKMSSEAACLFCYLALSTERCLPSTIPQIYNMFEMKHSILRSAFLITTCHQIYTSQRERFLFN